MEIFESNSFVVIAGIIAIGLILAPIIQVAWLMRILIASYISLCLIFLMPDSFAFSSYANAIYFGGIAILFALVARGRFFDVSEWSVGRFSVQVFVFSIFVWSFIIAAICFLLPLSFIDPFMTREVYEFLVSYIFYFAVAPLIFTILFSKYL